MFVNAACSFSIPIVDDAACLLISADCSASISDVDSIRFDVVVFSAVIWSRTSFWFASACATMTAVRSAEIVVVVARSTPLISSRLFLRTRSDREVALDRHGELGEQVLVLLADVEQHVLA